MTVRHCRKNSYKWLVFLTIGTGMFTTVTDAGSTIVALPTIAGQFSTDLPTTQWIVNAYALTISALLVPLGRLSDIMGRKRIYIAGFSIFSGGALLAGFSINILTLILSRVLMGIGAAMTQGSSMAIMISAFPPHERGKALGLQMSAVGSGAVAGPALGGVVVSAFGWRGIFFGISILGLLSATAATLILQPDVKEKGSEKPPFDWLGAAFSAGFLVLFLLGMSNGPKIGWTAPFVLGPFFGAALLLGLFIWWELRISAPMLDIRYFKERIFSIGVISRFLMFMGMAAVRYLPPFYFQSILGYSARSYGLIAIPASVATIAISPLAGRLSDRYGWKRFAVGGLIISIAGLILLAFVSVESSLLFVIGVWVLQMTGHAAFTAPNNASVLSVVDREKFGVIASFVNMVRNAGNVTGTALTTAIITSVLVINGLPPTLESVNVAADTYTANVFCRGMSVAFIVPAALISIALLLNLFLNPQADKVAAKAD